jgi:serine/threonine protein phosphatase 1
MKMLEAIYRDSRDLGQTPRIVLLGDYIDRGPASASVMESIVELQKQPWCDLVILLGNHEFFLANFLRDPVGGNIWLEHGGMTTLTSYGLKPPQDRRDHAQWEALARQLLRHIPRYHFELLYDAKLYFIAGDYLFVHAGVKPGEPLESQNADTFLWIREDFLAAEKSSPYVVVHGHSVSSTPENLEWRIGVDTGAYAFDVLTAVRLNENSRHIIQVKA